MSNPLFRFQIGEATRGFVSPTFTDRVGLNFGAAGAGNFNITMTAHEARAVANALYEAADAAEKVLPVVTAAPVAA